MDAWAQAETMAKTAIESGGIFLRLANDRDKTVVAFRGEPYAHDVHWTGTSYEGCTGKDCHLCASGTRATLRVACNVYVLREGTMKIMEGGARWFTDVLKVRNKYGLEKYAFEIERHGASGSPKTTYSILPDVPLDENLLRKMNGTELHDLKSEEVQQTVAREASAPAVPREPEPVARSQSPFNPPIDIGPAREIHQQLKLLAKPDVDAFLGHFCITKITDLHARDEQAARKFINDRLLPLI